MLLRHPRSRVARRGHAILKRRRQRHRPRQRRAVGGRRRQRPEELELARVARRRELPVVGTGLPLGVAVELAVVRRRARRRRRAARRRGGRLHIAAELALQLRTRADLGALGRPATALDAVDGASEARERAAAWRRSACSADAGESSVSAAAAAGVFVGVLLSPKEGRRLGRFCGGELPTLDPDFWCSSSCSSQSSWVVTTSRSAMALISFASHPCCACSANSSCGSCAFAAPLLGRRSRASAVFDAARVRVAAARVRARFAPTRSGRSAPRSVSSCRRTASGPTASAVAGGVAAAGGVETAAVPSSLPEGCSGESGGTT